MIEELWDYADEQLGELGDVELRLYTRDKVRWVQLEVNEVDDGNYCERWGFKFMRRGTGRELFIIKSRVDRLVQRIKEHKRRRFH